MAFCTICCSTVSKLRQSPTECSVSHTTNERACDECWEAHLSLEVEDKDPNDIECLFCSTLISKADLKSLAYKGTLNRYEIKLFHSTTQQCHARCAASRTHRALLVSSGSIPSKLHNDIAPRILQPHNRTTDGRVFTCAFCSFAHGLDCDRPEHVGESCWDYGTRVVFAPHHVRDIWATRRACKTCPECDVVVDLIGGKGTGCMVQCNCGYRFCERRCCLTPWIGEGSAYLVGREAHWEGCKYRTRKKVSGHTLKKRFEEDLGVVKRVVEAVGVTEVGERGLKRKVADVEGMEDRASERNAISEAIKEMLRADGLYRVVDEEDDG